MPVLIDDVKPPLAFRIAQSARLVGWPDQLGEIETLTAGITALLGAAPDGSAITPATKNSIAVLPFVNMSDDREQEFFSDGISEEIINALVGVPGLKVIARTSSFQFKGRNQDIREVGKMLDVNHLLEGSVRKAGDRIRVTAQLIATRDGAHLWSERFDRELTDVFAVQDEITEQIVKALRGTLLGVELAQSNPVDISAYTAYLKGQQYFSQFDIDQAIACFRQAIAIEPDYVDALGALARAHSHVLVMTGKRDSEMESCLERAERIAPDNRIVATTRVRDLVLLEFKHQQALDRLVTLLTRFPNDSDLLSSYAVYCINVGRPDLGVPVAERAVRTDPLSEHARSALAETLLRSGRLDEAETVLEQSTGLFTELWRGMIAALRGDMPALKQCSDMAPAGVWFLEPLYLKTMARTIHCRSPWRPSSPTGVYVPAISR